MKKSGYSGYNGYTTPKMAYPCGFCRNHFFKIFGYNLKSGYKSSNGRSPSDSMVSLSSGGRNSATQ